MVQIVYMYKYFILFFYILSWYFIFLLVRRSDQHSLKFTHNYKVLGLNSDENVSNLTTSTLSVELDLTNDILFMFY